MNHNRIAAFYGDDGEFVGMAKATTLGLDAATVDAEFVTSMIAERWVGTDRELAAAAGISVSGLADMKANGTKVKNKNFRKLCLQLGADIRAAAKGKRTYSADASTDRRQDLHELLNRIIGTDNEDAVERVLRGLAKVG